jgi:hypothetical protein
MTVNAQANRDRAREEGIQLSVLCGFLTTTHLPFKFSPLSHYVFISSTATTNKNFVCFVCVQYVDRSNY